MVSAPELESDLFVSYAHIDDQALAEGQKGWISTFHRALEIRLSQLLGKQPRIFRDPKLQGNDYFGDRLVGCMPKTAALVAVLSPRYVRSDWCLREVEEFCKASARAGGLRVADKARVFKVVKTPVPLDQHPVELQELLGYEFYTVERETGRPRELSQLADPEMQRQYWARLDDLAHDISELLSLLQADRADRPLPAGVPQTPEAAAKGFVYLAETSSDLQEKRDAVKRELQGFGYAVLPDRPLPLFGPECEAMVAEQLARCRLSVHLIGERYGVVPEGATTSVVAIQNELAVRRGGQAGDGFSRLIWLPPGLTGSAGTPGIDERQQRFIEHLRTDARLQRDADLLETPIEDFKSALHQRLQPPPPPSPRREAEAAAGAGDREDGPARVYLICDQRDLDAVAPLEDHLFTAGCEVILPAFDGDEAQVRRDHEESLGLCDAALLYYGAGSELWLRQKLRELQKAAAYGRSGPIAVRAVYVGPPEGAQKSRFRTHEALVLQPPAGAFSSFSPSSLDSFLSQLNQLKTQVGVPA
jgi:hypothetical protein